jgi:hypothetical protein
VHGCFSLTTTIVLYAAFTCFGALGERLRERYGEVRVEDLWWGIDLWTGEVQVQLRAWKGRITMNT